MLTLNNILKEINELPVDRLEDVYQFVHSLNIKKSENSRKRILSYAGSFSDMSSHDYKDFVAQTKKTREELFDRNSPL